MYVGGLSVERTRSGGQLQLNLSGELDLAAADELREELVHSEDEIRSQDAEGLVVDTTDVSFVDSSGLGVLADARDRLGDQLTLIPGQATRRVLSLTGTADFFDVSIDDDPGMR